MADRLLGRGDGKLAEAVGAAGARANMKGVVARIAFMLANPEYLMKRVAGLYVQFNDRGEMLVNRLAPGGAELEIRGRAKVYPVHCGLLTGWTSAVGVALGAVDPVTNHGSCIGRGFDRCVWTVRWTAARDGTIRRLPDPGKASRP